MNQHKSNSTNLNSHVAIDALSFSEYCKGLDALIQYGKPSDISSFLLGVYANKRNLITRSSLMCLLKDHIPYEYQERSMPEIYTWMKKQFSSSSTGSVVEDSIDISQASMYISSHPKGINQWLKIDAFNLMRFMEEKAVHEKVLRRSNKFHS